MKGTIILLAINLCLAYGEPPSGPYPASGWKPRGGLLILPSRQVDASAPPSEYGPPPKPEYGPPPKPEYGPPQQEYGPPTTEKAPVVNSTESGNIAELLRSTSTADSGVYYILGNDGKLHKIEYTTAPLKDIPSQETSSNGLQSQQSSFSSQAQYNQQASWNNREQSNTIRNSEAHQSFNRFSPEGSQVNSQADRLKQLEQNHNIYHIELPGDYPLPQTQLNSRQSVQLKERNLSNQKASIQSDDIFKVVLPLKHISSQIEDQKTQQKFSSFTQQSQSARQLSGQEFEQSYPVYQRSEAQQLSSNRQQEATSEKKSTESKEQHVEYLANIKYSKVDPVKPPIYSYNSEPLVRIIRK